MRKKGALSTLEASLEELKDDLLAGKQGCTFECQSILLGTLMKNMAARGIFRSREGSYFQGMSVTQAVQSVEAITSPDVSWHKKSSDYYHGCKFSLSDVTSTYARSSMNVATPFGLKELDRKVIT